MKTVKLKISELLAKEASLSKLLGAELPAKASYRLGRNLNKINSELENFAKVRNELIKKYGKEDKEGGIAIKPNTEAFKKYAAEIEPVMEEEVELELMQVSVDMLGDVKLKPVDMATLIDFVIIEEE